MTGGNEWYREILDATSDVVLVVDDCGTIQFVNRTVTEALGYGPGDLQGRSAVDLVHPADRPSAADGFDAFIGAFEDDASGCHPTAQFRHADGHWTTMACTSHSLLEASECDGYVVSLREDSTRQRRRHELATYETIFETAPVGMFALDETGVITMANDLYATTLDIPTDELIGTRFRELVDRGYYPDHLPDVYEDNVRELLTSTTDTEQLSYSVELSLPDGTTRVHEAFMGLLPRENGAFRGTVIAFRDATKERAYERELERQNERLDAFASMVGHDLRNPLSVARGRVQLAQETGDLDHLIPVDDAHERMECLVDDLLTLAREGEQVDEPRPVELERVARAAWRSVTTGDAALVVEDSRPLQADPSRLRQLFENLFRNAVEHGSTSPDSQTRPDAVEHGRVDGAALTVTVGTLPNEEGFYVADDGRGIPPEEREHVFTHGYSTNEDGTGLGLEIVSTIAEAHGWTVSLADRTDGARFDVATGPS